MYKKCIYEQRRDQCNNVPKEKNSVHTSDERLNEIVIYSTKRSGERQNSELCSIDFFTRKRLIPPVHSLKVLTKLLVKAHKIGIL